MQTQNTKKNSKNSTANPKKKINLALQGGGSHGAFTWGVLDRLLEENFLFSFSSSSSSSLIKIFLFVLLIEKF